MSGTITRTSIGVALLTCVLLMSTSAHALRDDKIYKVMMLCEGDCSELPELDAMRDEIAGILPPGPSTVWPVSASELASMSFDELPQYTFVVWHFRGSQGATTSELEAAAQRVLAAEVPAVIVDDQGFPISRAFGLTTFVDGGQHADPICAHADTEARGVFHHLMSEFIEIDSDQVLFNTPIDGPSTRVNYVDRGAVDTGAYTRPVMSVGDYVGPYSCVSSEEDPSQVLVIANDRKRIAASGLYEHGVYDVPFLLHNMVDYVTAVGPESAMANWIDQPALDHENESILFSPGGQSVQLETDWTQSSRGFDFEVKRTYRSGAADLYSYLGENWYLNHDRYLVHDKVNGQLHVHDGTGSVTTMMH
ncbi:MAG: hypothetical protein JRF63_14640, partial [Deltaproteobacteria bacterium]|nr:hypothetical protein [Deltaproteobacteria bacterium]